MLPIIIAAFLVIMLFTIPFIFPTLHLRSVSLALAGRPGDHEGWYYYGNLLTKYKKYIRAYDALMMAVKIKPDFSKAWVSLGDLLLELGDSEGAEKAYHNAMTGDLSEF